MHTYVGAGEEKIRAAEQHIEYPHLLSDEGQQQRHIVTDYGIMLSDELCMYIFMHAISPLIPSYMIQSKVILCGPLHNLCHRVISSVVDVSL